MPNLDQMPGRLVGAAPLVHAHRIDARISLAHQQHDGIVRAPQHAQMIELPVPGGIDQDAVDLARAHHLDGADFLGQIVIGGGE